MRGGIMAGWYIRRGDSVIGPATIAKLKELVADGRLRPTDELATDAGGPWTEAGRTPLFLPQPGANVLPPAPQTLIPKSDNPPALETKPNPDQRASIGKIAAAVRTSKTIVVAIGQGALTAGGGLSRAISAWSQRRHELKVAKIQANALAAGQRPDASPTAHPTGPIAFSPQTFQTTVIKIVNRNDGCGCSGCGSVLLLSLLAILAYVIYVEMTMPSKGPQAPIAPANPNATPVVPIPNAAIPSAPTATDASQPIQRGDVRVRIDSVKIGIVPLVGFNDTAGASKDRLLMVALTIENTSTTQKIDFRGFAVNDFGLSDAATLEDNHGNFYRRVGFGYTDYPKGQVRAAESIYPGKSLTDLLVFEVPIDKAESLVLELPAKTVGADWATNFRFQIPASMIVGRAVANEQHQNEQPTNAPPPPPAKPPAPAGPPPAATAKESATTDPASAEPARPAADVVEPKHRMRIWTSADGKTLEAQFLWYANGTVALKKPDGTTVKLPMERFSEPDQIFIHQGAKE
jgi:hypothetical protein